MWSQVVLLTMLQLIWLSTSWAEPLEGPLWLDRLSDIIRESDMNEQIGSMEGQDSDVSYYSNLVKSDTRMGENKKFQSSLKSPSEKRALSMFARWGSINTIGKERNPIRSGYPPRSSDSISTQTRSRMLGQPLRWG